MNPENKDYEELESSEWRRAAHELLKFVNMYLVVTSIYYTAHTMHAMHGKELFGNATYYRNDGNQIRIHFDDVG